MNFVTKRGDRFPGLVKSQKIRNLSCERKLKKTVSSVESLMLANVLSRPKVADDDENNPFCRKCAEMPYCVLQNIQMEPLMIKDTKWSTRQWIRVGISYGIL